MNCGRSSISEISFYILGDEDVEQEAVAVSSTKATFSEGIPVLGGLYDPHYGATELGWNCQKCFNNKMLCPGHDGMAVMNYRLQNPLFRKEIMKWLRIVCHKCGEFVIKKQLSGGISSMNKLSEFVKYVRAGTEKYRKCEYCDALHPWITKDPLRQGVIWKEWYDKGSKIAKAEKEIMYNNEIAEVLGRISDQNVVKMGKTPASHPRKLILKNIKISANPIRPEIRKIGGNRSTMSDVTVHLKTIMELNNQIPKEMPANIDIDLHAKMVLIDLTFFEMIQGSSGTGSQLKLVTNTNKVSNSIASRIPKKQGRLRANLMGKRTRKMARSVISGDKALRPDQVGVPKMIAMGAYIQETVRPWNRDRLTVYFLNGPKVYPGCSKIKRKDTGYEHYVESISRDYILQDGDIIWRNIVDGDTVGFNREPSLLYCSIAMLTVKIVDGFTLRINSSVCVLFHKSVWIKVGCL